MCFHIEIGCHLYVFDNASEAMTFAVNAVKHDKNNAPVRIWCYASDPDAITEEVEK